MGLATGFSGFDGREAGLGFFVATGAGLRRTTFLAGRGVALAAVETDRRGLAAFFIAFFAMFKFR
ncbi:MAG TPA: hypothetical protein DCR20_04705 [Planctomycetaceae bacterium]|nr:hypothetical protein [Planctomycetaceae bacterium]